MSHYSQHRFPKDCDETEPIIIVIDCSVQFLPLGNIHTWAFVLWDTLQWHGVFMRGFHHKLILYVPSHPLLMKTGVRWSPHCFMLVNAQTCFFYFKTWGSCQWPDKATADTWDYRRSWRCDPEMTWCWSVPRVHPNHRSTLGIRTWERFHRRTRLLLYEHLPSLAFHFSPLNFLKPHFSSHLSPFQTFLGRSVLYLSGNLA